MHDVLATPADFVPYYCCSAFSPAKSRIVPALLLFLAVGMLAGSYGTGRIYFDDPNIAQFVGVVALALILFYGGLDTDWQSVRPCSNTA